MWNTIQICVHKSALTNKLDYGTKVDLAKYEYTRLKEMKIADDRDAALEELKDRYGWQQIMDTAMEERIFRKFLSVKFT